MSDDLEEFESEKMAWAIAWWLSVAIAAAAASSSSSLSSVPRSRVRVSASGRMRRRRGAAHLRGSGEEVHKSSISLEPGGGP